MTPEIYYTGTMNASAELLESRLRAAALMVLRDHGVGADDLVVESGKRGASISGHRIRIHVDDSSATLLVRAGRWSGRRVDFPSAGGFIAAFEAALSGALR